MVNKIQLLKILLGLTNILMATSLFAFDYGNEELYNQNPEPSYSSKSNENFKFLKWPIREYSVIATDEGYYPSTLTVFLGEQLKINITSVTDRPSCFFLEDQKLFLSAIKGRVVHSEVKFDRVGEFIFYCPSQKIKGKVVVLKRPKFLPPVKRNIASEDNEAWVPKEY